MAAIDGHTPEHIKKARKKKTDWNSFVHRMHEAGHA